jgi:cytoskeleton protein RodZ
LETIPGGFFSRAFVRQFAVAVGLSEEQISRAMDSVSPPPEDSVHFEKFAAEYRPNTGRYAPPERDEEGGQPDFLHEATFLRERHLNGWWTGVVVLLIAASAGFLALRNQPGGLAAWLTGLTGARETQARQAARQQPSQTSAPPADSPAAAVAESAPAENASTGLTQESTAATAADPGSAPAASNPPAPAASQSAVVPATQAAAPANAAPSAAPAPIQVVVTANERSWIRLAADNRRVFIGVLEAGQSQTISAAGSATLFTGNAGGLGVTFNGRAVGQVGPRGMVRTVVFNPQEFEVLTSSPVPSQQ